MPKGRCLLRHDVDADIQAALIMAELEYEIGVSSTYFLMLRSPLYNLMSRHSQLADEQILQLGHEVGLHYDQGFDVLRGYSLKQTSEAILHESELLEQQFSTSVAAVSFHQPGSAVLQADIDCGALINTYDRNKLTAFAYYSDSNRRLSFAKSSQSIEDSITSKFPEPLQLLIHPIWWVYADSSTEEVWDRAIFSNFQSSQRQLLETESAYGLERVLKIGRI